MMATTASGDKGQRIDQVKPLDRKLDKTTEKRGRYVIKIAGCNDCHIVGYAEMAGKIPEQNWFKGDTIGWRGPSYLPPDQEPPKPYILFPSSRSRRNRQQPLTSSFSAHDLSRAHTTPQPGTGAGTSHRCLGYPTDLKSVNRNGHPPCVLFATDFSCRQPDHR
jgi:hypothetical protein